MIRKAELCAADYKNKYDSLQATSSERIQELELSNQEREEKIRKADDLNTSLYQKFKDCRLSEGLSDQMPLRAPELWGTQTPVKRARDSG